VCSRTCLWNSVMCQRNCTLARRVRSICEGSWSSFVILWRKNANWKERIKRRRKRICINVLYYCKRKGTGRNGENEGRERTQEFGRLDPEALLERRSKPIRDGRQSRWLVLVEWAASWSRLRGKEIRRSINIIN
jgi:hypothetical protein